MFRYIFNGIPLLLFSMVSTLAFCAPGGTVHGPSVRLVRAAHLDRIAMLAVPQVYFRHADRTDSEFVKFTRCVTSADSNGFVDIFADAVQVSMTADEIQTALHFYDSDFGKKIASLAVAQAMLDLGLQAETRPTALSVQEQAKLDSFNQSTASRKLATEQLLKAATTARRFFEFSEQLAMRCKPS